MRIRSQGTFEEYRKIRQGYEIDNRKIFGEYAEDVIGVKECAGVKHNTIYEKLHKEKEMMEAKCFCHLFFRFVKKKRFIWINYSVQKSSAIPVMVLGQRRTIKRCCFNCAALP